MAAMGAPSILLNNAGISVLHRALDFGEADFERQVAVNLKAPSRRQACRFFRRHVPAPCKAVLAADPLRKGQAST